MSNDNIESISDKLRRWVEESEELHTFPIFVGEKEFTGSCGNSKQKERELFRYITDEIDREMDELRELVNPGGQPIGEAVREIATGEDKYPWGDSKYPLLKEAIEHYYLPLPLFEDGEPVQLCDRYLMMNGTPDIVSSFAYTKGDADYVRINGHRMELHERVKRPKQPVLDADGVPIEVGDTVYILPGEHCDRVPIKGFAAGAKCIVGNILNPNHRTKRGSILARSEKGVVGYPAPGQVTHREPDSQERIDDDAMKSLSEYWECVGCGCGDCPAAIDGKNPYERYENASDCADAQRLDLLRRQRELDGRDA